MLVYYYYFYYYHFYSDGLYRLHTYAENEEDEAKEHKWLSLVTESTYFKFRVQACDSAHIALATNPGDISSLHYEVVFGKI